MGAERGDISGLRCYEEPIVPLIEVQLSEYLGARHQSSP